MRRATNVAIAVAGVFAVSFYAYGQLGGAQGIDVPYSGFLEENGGPVTDTDVDFQFQLYDGPAGAYCNTVTVNDVVVVDGRFALVLDNVPANCVVGKDVHVEVLVDTGAGVTTLTGRQRLFPALAAPTSGTGDFSIPGTLTVTGAATMASVSATGAVTGGSLSTANALTSGSVSTGAVSASSVSSTGDIRVTGSNGQLGASTDKVFRDTGDNWLRLNNASGSTTYADLAVGQLYAASDLYAEGNSWGSCYWTGWISAGNATQGQTPANCSACNALVCNSGYYAAAHKLAHVGGNGDYWTGIQFATYCCRL